jgi:dUTP pyrophosphatase
MLVPITRLRKDIPLPTYATDGSVAFDLALADDVTVPAHGTAFGHTGLIVATPPGYVFFIAPRSSTFKKKGLRLGNGVGLIDQDFCGPEDETLLFLWNPGDNEVILQKGERIAQGMFLPITRAEWQEGEVISENSRGKFGHSGGYVEQA